MGKGLVVGIIMITIVIGAITAMQIYDRGGKAQIAASTYAVDDVYIEMVRDMSGAITARVASLSKDTKVEISTDGNSTSPPSPGYTSTEVKPTTIVKIYKRWMSVSWLPYQELAVTAPKETLPLVTTYSMDRTLQAFEVQFARRLMLRQVNQSQDGSITGTTPASTTP